MQKEKIVFTIKMKMAFVSLLFITINTAFGQITNVRSGVWSDQATWSNNILPSDTTNVILNYDITIDINSSCKSLNANGHNVIVDSGIVFNIGTPLIGGYASSDSVAPANLIAYWPFDGDANDHKEGLPATTVGVTYNAGIRGQAYQGNSGAYATLALPGGNAFATIGSYTFSVWYKLPAQPSGNNPFDPEGLFFLTGNTNLDLMVHEIEPYSPVSGDSVRIHHGFNDLGSPAYQTFIMESFDTMAINKWVHLVTTYDGTFSTYTFYQNGVPMGVISAFSNSLYIKSTQLWTDNTMTTPLGQINYSSDPPTGIVLGTWPAGLFGVSPSLGSNGCFLGQMDELRIYNRALTQAEVTGLYLNGAMGR